MSGFERLGAGESVEDLLAAPGALLLVFGAAHCGVCQAIKPRIEQALAEDGASGGIRLVDIDCELAPQACAQHGVFSLPVCRFYLDGRLMLERARVFSLVEMLAEIGRLHGLWRASQ